MMRMEVRSVQVPRWIVPVLILAALALIPFALMLALVVAGIAIGAAAVRLLLTGPQPKGEGLQRVETQGSRPSLSTSQVIDVDYEVKDEK